MARSLLTRGMLAGLVAGLLAAGFTALFGEPQVNHAIAFGDQVRRLAGEPPDAVIVSRTIQSSLGMVAGMVIYGVSFGGIFAIVFAIAYGRVGRVAARVTAALLAGGGFVGIYLVPSLKYPANPPSVGRPDTIGYRSELYLIMILLSVLGLIAAVLLGRQLVLRSGYRAWNAALIASAGYIAVMAVVMIVMPGINEVPSSFSATLLWRFRLASLGTQLVLWATVALGFGVLAERLLEPRSFDPTNSLRGERETVG